MPDLSAHIDRIREKAQELFRRGQALQKEVERLTKENDLLRSQEATQMAQINQLRRQVDVLKMNVGSLNDQDKKALEKQLNQYIREIDRCIALLTE